MYASSEMKILRVLSREELFEIIYNSNNDDRVRRLVSSIELTSNEINLIKEKYPRVIPTIEYYQNEKFLFLHI